MAVFSTFRRLSTGFELNAHFGSSWTIWSFINHKLCRLSVCLTERCLWPKDRHNWQIGSLGETAAVSGFSRNFFLLLKSTKPECRIILKHLACQCELSFLGVRTLGQWERGNLRIALLYSTLSPPLCDNVTTLDNVSGSRTMESWKFLDLSQSPSLHLCKLEERDISFLSLLLWLNENLEFLKIKSK